MQKRKMNANNVAKRVSLFIFIVYLATGEFDIDDVLLNTTGAAIGYFFFRKIKKSLAAYL